MLYWTDLLLESVAEGRKEYACPATTLVLGVPAIVRLPEEAVEVDEALLVWDVELVEATALVGATELVEPTELVGATELVEPTELVGATELVEPTGLVEPTELAVSAVASDEDEPEDPPHPAIIPESNTSAQQTVPREDFRRTILRTSELNRRGSSRQRCAKEAVAMTCRTPIGASRQ
jgi:hypothetical protein